MIAAKQSLVVLHVLQEILFVIFAAAFLAGGELDADVAFVDLLLEHFGIEAGLKERKKFG